MNPREIMDHLRPGRFRPSVFVTNSGDRYEVRHPELARVMENGVVYLFHPSTRPEAHYQSMTVLAWENIAAIEPSLESPV